MSRTSRSNLKIVALSAASTLFLLAGSALHAGESSGVASGGLEQAYAAQIDAMNLKMQSVLTERLERHVAVDLSVLTSSADSLPTVTVYADEQIVSQKSEYLANIAESGDAGI